MATECDNPAGAVGRGTADRQDRSRPREMTAELPIVPVVPAPGVPLATDYYLRVVDRIAIFLYGRVREGTVLASPLHARTGERVRAAADHSQVEL